jgi:manganese/zinc/iron transport system permease protein
MEDASSAFFAALTFQGGFNSALVALGAALLGAAAGGVGTFLLLRRRALVSDAISHSALPGVAGAFLVMAAFGGDGRWLPGQLLGAALTGGLGLWLIDRAVRRTRLAEDAAIGVTLSSFFGAGVVLLTVIQGLTWGKAAGLEGFLLGSAAGMLQSEALAIAGCGLLGCALIFALRRPLVLISFDPGFARAAGVPLVATDLAMMAVALMITVVGLKVAGVVLIVALLIIPAAAARFWTEDVGTMALIAALIGAIAGHVGASLSAAGPGLPTGPLIVLTAAAIFAASLALAPRRGAAAGLAARGAFRVRLARHRGLMALARGADAPDRASTRALKRAGWIDHAGAATPQGRAAAADALHDEARWTVARRDDDALAALHHSLRPIEEALSAQAITAIDRRLAAEAKV